MITFQQWLEQFGEENWDDDNEEMRAYQKQMWPVLQQLTKDLSNWNDKTYSVAVDATTGHQDPLNADSFIFYIDQEEIMRGDLSEIYAHLQQLSRESGMM